jgi:peptidoglycan/LPS O-acetylase OafA/YrhL
VPNEILLLNDKGVSQDTFLLWRVLTIWTEPLFQIWRYSIILLFFALFFFLWILTKKLNRKKYLARVFLCGVFGFAFVLLSIVAVWSWGLLLLPMLVTALFGFVAAKRIVKTHFQ